MKKLDTVSKNKTWFYEDLDLELLIAKFRLRLKEVGKVGEKRPKPNPL